MNSCAEYQPLISRLLDGELPAVQESDVQQHISHCANCRQIQASWEFQGRSCRAYLRQHALAEDFVARVKVATQRASASRPSNEKGWLHGDLFSWLQVAAALLISAVLLNRFFPWAAQPAIGQVLNPGARLEMRASASHEWKPAPAGIALHTGDWLRNAEDNRAQILIRDASRLILQGGTVAQLGPGVRDVQNHLVLMQGSLQSESLADARELQVSTPAGNMLSGGARFEVRVDALMVPRLEISDQNDQLLQAAVEPMTTLLVEKGAVRVENAATSREVAGGSTAHFTRALFGVAPGTAQARQSVRAELQTVRPPYAGGSLLESSLTAVEGRLEMLVQAREIPLRRLLEWSTDSQVQGGDDIRISGRLAYSVDTKADSIASAIAEQLHIPITVKEEQRAVKTGFLPETPREAENKGNADFTVKLSREGLLSVSFRRVPAAQAMRALRAVSPDMPAVADASKSQSVTIEIRDIHPDRLLDQLKERTGLVVGESVQKIQVISVGMGPSGAHSLASPGRKENPPEPMPERSEVDALQQGPLLPNPFEMERSEASVAFPSNVATASSGAGNYEAGIAYRSLSSSGAVSPEMETLVLNPPLTYGKFGRSGAIASGSEALSGSKQISPVKMRNSRHLIWPPVDAAQHEWTYTVFNLSDRMVRTLWIGYGSDGRILHQVEHVVGVQSKTEINPARDWGLYLEVGGHWEVLSDTALQIIEDELDPGFGFFAPVDVETAHRNWEFDIIRMISCGPQPGIWVANTGQTTARVVVALILEDQAEVSQQFYIAPHAVIRWSLDDLRSRHPQYVRIPLGAVVLVSTMEGVATAGVLPDPAGGTTLGKGSRGEWVH